MCSRMVNSSCLFFIRKLEFHKVSGLSILDYPSVFSNLCIVYPMLSVSGLSILDYPSVFSNLCIVYPVLSVSGLSILDCPSVLSNLCSVYCVPSVVDNPDTDNTGYTIHRTKVR
jgi:hypothetical protein